MSDFGAAVCIQPWQIMLVSIAGWINKHQQQVIEFQNAQLVECKKCFAGKRIPFSDDQRRRLGEKAKALGRAALSEITTLVTPDTLLRWHRELVAKKWTYPKNSPGRPRLSEEIVDLIVKPARENPTWGYDYLVGAMANLGHKVSGTSVANVLKDHGIEPAPTRRKGGDWIEFLRAHWETFAATDFFTVEVWTPKGLVTYYVLFVMELATRRAHLAGITPNPHSAWMAQIARNLTDDVDGFLQGKTHLLMDRDAKFTAEFRSTLRDAGVEPKLLPPSSPNLNAYAERFVRSIREQCLDRMIFFGEEQLRRAIVEYLAYYHQERNHQGLGNALIKPADHVGQLTGEIAVRERLGGMLRYYYRQAA